jgi:type IV pilus assembly protein PilC
MANKSLIKINTYVWKGFTSAGSKSQGEINSTSIALARAELRRQGVTLTKISKKTKPLFFRSGAKRIKAVDIAVFSRQLATMLSAGIPLVQAFDIVAKGMNNPTLQKMIVDIKNDVETGTPFASALAKYPKYFNELYTNLVNAGEQSGTLDVMLGRIATYKEKIETLKGKIRKALFYPTAVIFVAFLVTAGMLVFIVPQFESLFKGFGADLPALTNLVIRMSEYFQRYWWLVFGSIGAGVWFFMRAMRQSTHFAGLVDKFILRLPILGDIIRKAVIARFTRTLAVTFAAGLPLINALQAVAGATGNQVYQLATNRIRESVATGQQLQLALKETELFPNFVVQMIAIGEEAGSLETMLSKVADFYEEEVDNAVDGLSSLLEPLIMIILGVLVGGLVVAMYLPIFKLGSVV